MGWSRPAAVAVAALAALAGAAPGWDHILVPGQKAFGVIDEADEVDQIQFHAETGWSLDFKIKARKGEFLLPIVTELKDPDGASLLGTVPLKVSKTGTSVHLGKFVAAKTGTYTLGISGDATSTGTWDLVSKGPPTIPLGTGTIAAPSGETTHAILADEGTVALLQVKASAGSFVHPSVARVERPEAAGDVDLSAAVRKTTTKLDKLSNVALLDNGSYGLVVTGADGTTGDYVATMKVGKTVALDFSEDPPDEPPPPPAPSVSSVNPTTKSIPAAGTSNESMTVTGANFVDGCTTAITAPSGTNGITNVQTTFNSSTSLSLSFDLASTATAGNRTVTVTNPDAQSGAKSAAFTCTVAPTLTVTAVTPSSGPGAGGTRVLIQGSQFTSAAAVTFGSLPARAVNVVDAQNILCTVPTAATLSTTAGTAVNVTVDLGGGNSATLAGGFTYDADVNRPVVLSTVPAFGSTGVPINNSRTVFVLDEPIAAATVIAGNFDFFKSGGNNVNSPRVLGVGLSPDGKLIVLQHNFPTGGTLSTSGTHLFQISNANVTDIAGNGFDAVNSNPSFVGPAWQGNWVTGTGTDAVKPIVNNTVPAAAAINVDVDVAPTVNFSEPVDPTSVTTSVTLKQGVTLIPCDLEVDALCTTVTLTPRTKLSASTAYTIGVSTVLRDLAGNTINTAFAAGFNTAAADGTLPTQSLTVDALAQDMNGSTTYVAGPSNAGSGSAGAATAFNVYLPRSGFTIDLTFGDAGGSGIDASSFSFTCSAAMGSVGAGQELASLFSVTPLGATWTVDSGHALAAGTNITFTANVSDYAGNAAATDTLAVDVADITRTITNAAGTASTDRDPFNSRQSWLLRFDQDIWTVTRASGAPNWDPGTSHPHPFTITTALSSNGTSDFEEDLVLLGLNGPETGTNASTVTNGSATGTKAIVQKLVKDAVRGHLRERFGITYAGSYGADSANIEFLLAGETKAAGGTVNPGGWTTGSGFSMMTFTGDERAVSASDSSISGAIGRATYDKRNTSEEDDSNTGNVGANLGTFGTHMIRVRINDPGSTTFPVTFDPLISANSRGGTPVGADNNDAIVLAGTFVYASGTAAQKTRYDLIANAIDRYALYLSATGAHEIGHSTGLCPDGAPPTGLFGNAHPNNTFIEDPGSYTTTIHIDTPGSNIMQAASSFDEGIATGTGFQVFEPLSMAYLLRRMIYDQ